MHAEEQEDIEEVQIEGGEASSEQADDKPATDESAVPVPNDEAASSNASINDESPQMQILEIENENPNPHKSFDHGDNDDDLEGLLPKANVNTAGTATSHPSSGNRRVGNCYIFAPSVYQRSGWGMAGPHWFGPPMVVGVIIFATAYYFQSSRQRIGPISAYLCLLLCVSSIYNLIQCCYRDPGIVSPSIGAALEGDEGARYCDACDQYQPSDGAHCSDCDVCVQGFDHHCVWMGCCIGKDNLKPFVRFNLTWMFYLLYAIVWCSVLGPLIL